MTTQTISKGRKIASWVLVTLVALVLLGSAFGKLSGAPPVLEGFEKFHLSPWRVHIGALEAAIGLLFLIPRTSSLGTLLLTGYFGGAIAIHLTTASPGDIIAPALIGFVGWVGNFLRNSHMFGSFSEHL